MNAQCISGKVIYPGRNAARAALSKFKAEGDGRFKRSVAREYQCPHCGKFHITSRPDLMIRRPKAHA